MSHNNNNTLSIVTWNVNSIKIRLPQVMDFLEKENPDILCLQEIKCVTEAFPWEPIQSLGYEALVNGQKTYNGMAILSKIKPEDVCMEIPNWPDPQRRVLAATLGGIRVLNLYVPNGESVDSAKYTYKLDWLTHLNYWLCEEIRSHQALVLVGDFNIAPTDCDVHEPSLWEGRVLFSEPERLAFAGLCEVGLKDAFRLFEQPPKSYSWWDYRQLAFRRNRGLRIDHILVSEKMAHICESCTIHKAYRGLERPSDHAPVQANFHWPLL